MPQVEGAVGFPQDIRNFALEQFKAFAGLEKSLLRQEIRVIFYGADGLAQLLAAGDDIFHGVLFHGAVSYTHLVWNLSLRLCGVRPTITKCPV